MADSKTPNPDSPQCPQRGSLPCSPSSFRSVPLGHTQEERVAEAIDVERTSPSQGQATHSQPQPGHCAFTALTPPFHNCEEQQDTSLQSKQARKVKQLTLNTSVPPTECQADTEYGLTQSTRLLHRVWTASQPQDDSHTCTSIDIKAMSC